MKYRLDEPAAPLTNDRDFAHSPPDRPSPVFMLIAVGLMLACGVFGWVYLLLGMT